MASGNVTLHGSQTGATVCMPVRPCTPEVAGMQHCWTLRLHRHVLQARHSAKTDLYTRDGGGLQENREEGNSFGAG